MPRRECGDCQLCCRLLPVVALEKKGGEKCKFQKFHKGCTVYNMRQMPPECRLWSCRWLVNDDADDLARPDRSHYVIDIMPDFITIVDNATGAKQHVQVVQIWCDPNHRDAHRDPALRAWLARRGEQCVAAIIRFAATGEALLVFPPQLSHDGQWHEVISRAPERTHSFREIVEALSEGEAPISASE